MGDTRCGRSGSVRLGCGHGHGRSRGPDRIRAFRVRYFYLTLGSDPTRVHSQRQPVDQHSATHGPGGAGNVLGRSVPPIDPLESIQLSSQVVTIWVPQTIAVFNFSSQTIKIVDPFAHLNFTAGGPSASGLFNTTTLVKFGGQFNDSDSGNPNQSAPQFHVQLARRVGRTHGELAMGHCLPRWIEPFQSMEPRLHRRGRRRTPNS